MLTEQDEPRSLLPEWDVGPSLRLTGMLIVRRLRSEGIEDAGFDMSSQGRGEIRWR